MDPLFEGEPGTLPERSELRGTWAVTEADFENPPPPEVEHARGYEAFVALAADYGTDPRSLFDL